MDPTKLATLPKVVFNNEDFNFGIFLKAFFEKGEFSNGPISLRCKKSTTARSIGSKLKKVELEFSALEGIY